MQQAEHKGRMQSALRNFRRQYDTQLKLVRMVDDMIENMKTTGQLNDQTANTWSKDLKRIKDEQGQAHKMYTQFQTRQRVPPFGPAPARPHQAAFGPTLSHPPQQPGFGAYATREHGDLLRPAPARPQQAVFGPTLARPQQEPGFGAYATREQGDLLRPAPARPQQAVFGPTLSHPPQEPGFGAYATREQGDLLRPAPARPQQAVFGPTLARPQQEPGFGAYATRQLPKQSSSIHDVVAPTRAPVSEPGYAPYIYGRKRQNRKGVKRSALQLYERGGDHVQVQLRKKRHEPTTLDTDSDDILSQEPSSSDTDIANLPHAPTMRYNYPHRPDFGIKREVVPAIIVGSEQTTPTPPERQYQALGPPTIPFQQPAFNAQTAPRSTHQKYSSLLQYDTARNRLAAYSQLDLLRNMQHQSFLRG